MTGRTMWLVEHADGSVSQHHDRPGEDGIDEGVRSAKLPRELDLLVERWDWKTGKIVAVPEGEAQRVNDLHVDTHGEFSILVAHMKKEIEARLFLKGIAIGGLLEAEARATGQDAGELARAIVANADALNSAEVERISSRRAALAK